MSSESLNVTGELVFESLEDTFSNATTYIRLEDVTLIDTPSKVISEQVLRKISYDSNNPSGRVAFSLYVGSTDPKAKYAISVHVDINNNGKIDSGDYINMESYPVITYGNPNNAIVRVRKIK